MKFLKSLVAILAVFGFLVFAYGYLNSYGVIDIIKESIKKEVTIIENNKYAKEYNLDFPKLTDNFIAHNKDDIINIYFTVINSGMDSFTFYCDKNYKECMNDINIVTTDEDITQYINNLVHPFNTFNKIKTSFKSISFYWNGNATIDVIKSYSNEDIIKINNEVDSIYNKIIKSDDDEKNIKSVHDYIINNTKYNKEYNSKYKDEINVNSSNIKGPLFYKVATCNGYSELTSLFLDKLNIDNVRVSNDKHIWNAVYINNKWLHLDVTWDDPLNNLDKDLLLYDYYLKDTKEIKKFDSKEKLESHDFNEELYSFLL